MISGKDRGKTGAVISVSVKDSKITAEGINLYKKRTRPKQQGQKGETVMVARPFAVSNAMIICSNCKKASRVGFKVEGAGKTEQKFRYCKKCGSRI